MTRLPLNTGFAGATQILGARLDPYLSSNFLVELEGLVVGGFMEVSGLESQLTTEDYREGGVNDYVHHLPTRVEYPNLVLSRGMTDVDVLWGWYSDAAQGKIRLRNGTIMLLDRQHLPVQWWNFRQAYPVRWVGPQFNAMGEGAIAMEQIELVHRGISKPAAARALAVARGAANLGGFTGTQQILGR